ncbi:MAG TPA: neutral zinc metallopeptidase [Rhodocyclaceae bacterium]|nr:neutral zinc metallopeptidase [Rhodocyclaceae bacterium]
MRWNGNRESDNIEDRRGSGGGGMPMLGGGRIGLGTVAIALVGWLVFDINPMTLLEAMSGGGQMQVQQGPAQRPPADDPMAKFVSVVLADTEDVWRDIFSKQGAQYRDPHLVLFSGATATACGTGQAAMGPFYCPADEKVYIDLGFYQTMKTQLGAPGDFAQAYVIAHEVGHHVQNLLGISEKVHAQRQRVSEKEGNALSVRQELQADCFAGVWAYHAQDARKILESGDLEEALNAASQIGDDTLQRSAGRAVVPDSFTHGSGKQRVQWFREGFESGDVRRCNTFKAARL